MKTWIKISIGVGTVLAIATPAITIPLVRKYSTHIFDKDMFKANKNYAEKNHAINYNSSEDDIINTANEADINLFFTPAVAPFNNLLRLSMITNKENHFFIIKDSEREGFEDLVDSKKLEDFYNNSRKDSNGRSTVVDVYGGVNETATKVLEKMHVIINNNLDKKINIWWNDTWVEAGYWKDRILNLSGFTNVNIQLIEDGVSNGIDIKQLKDRISNQEWDPSSTNKYNQVLSSVMCPGLVRGWYSSSEFSKLNSITNVPPKSYNTFEYKALSDGVFNTRDKDGNRLMKYWPTITGLNWEHEAKIVMDANKNGKKDLLVLGSYGIDGEEDYIMSVWKRYHEKYNVFYKGHPGHMDHPLFVQNEMLDKKLDSMYQLEPMIASEELTRDHVKPNDWKPGDKGLYLQFDKVVGIGETSAITASSFPNLDIKKDVLEIYGDKDEDHNFKVYRNPDLSQDSIANPDSNKFELADSWSYISDWLDTQSLA